MKKEIVLFTDKRDEGTLNAFCKDLSDVPAFKQFVNDPDNLGYAEAFVIYKKTSEEKEIIEQYECTLDEAIQGNQLSTSVADKIKYWLDRAADYNKRLAKF